MTRMVRAVTTDLTRTTSTAAAAGWTPRWLGWSSAHTHKQHEAIAVRAAARRRAAVARRKEAVPRPLAVVAPPKEKGRGNRYLGQKVYAIVDDRASAVKIGIAANPDERLRDLQVGCAGRLRIVAVAAGGRPLERALHERLAAHRLRENGEWFEMCPEVLAEIERLSVPEAA